LKTVVIACCTIEDEINAVQKTLPNPLPVVWTEAGLHNYPLKLKDGIRQEINSISGAENILLLSGYCGNTVEGLVAPRAQLVIPRVEDCISLLLGGDEIRHEVSSKAPAYFLTEGWLRYEHNICWEYERCVEKYGKAMTLRIFQSMLAHYSAFDFINTGSYHVKSAMTRTTALAASLNLSQNIVPGNLRLIAKALRGEWDEEFLIVPPGVPVHLEYCRCGPLQTA